LSSESDDRSERRATRAFWVFVVLVMAVVMLVTWLAIRYDWGGELRQREQTPCEDQAPQECVGETIEQASSSQFIHYSYCACMTDDGLAKGYIAARVRGNKVE
jgi:hypothetical protein